ncbi:CBO0543 family protein [Virgibacillus kekensis]|uniref:CBO0543 family protein n=1 Tax=Virgibacillus kekensis TaxID=202261 RepID=A0ABV9DRC3_9BACI
MDLKFLLMSALLIVILLFGIGCIYFIRLDWKRYGALFLISLIFGNIFCQMFISAGLYTFNNAYTIPFLVPYGLVSTTFPFIVMFGARYSPEQWIWKIPFYWAVVHLGILGEVIFKHTFFFRFEDEWDLWDSYTLWWIYFLLLELLSGKIIPDNLRKPVPAISFRYGNWAWIGVHVILIITIFLAGVYTGVTVL